MDVSFLDFPDDMRLVEEHLQASVRSGCDLLRDVADYVKLGGGKKLRPRLLLLVAHATAAAGDEKSSAPPTLDSPLPRVAASVELVHVASLLHDDVVDKTAMRRGRESVNARYGDDVAILMADLFYAGAFDLALSALDPEVMRLLCRATRDMCESEIFQIEKRDAILTRDDYYHIIRLKTASLFSICAELGGIVSGVSPERRQALAEFGRLIGMTYQIADDVLDYTTTTERLGKPQGNDLAQGKQTLPLVHACEQATPDDREALLAQLRNGRQMSKVMAMIQKYNGIDYAADRARDYARRAEALIPDFGPNSAEPLFRSLCRYAIERSF